MINAKNELKTKLSRIGKTENDVVAFKIIYSPGLRINSDTVTEISSKGPLTDEVWKSLDFEYEDGYGTQHLFGLILFNDNSWLERSEYDGSEWWEYKKTPTIEEILNFKGN